MRQGKLSYVDLGLAGGRTSKSEQSRFSDAANALFANHFLYH
jgi:hypothetical protein